MTFRFTHLDRVVLATILIFTVAFAGLTVLVERSLSQIHHVAAEITPIKVQVQDLTQQSDHITAQVSALITQAGDIAAKVQAGVTVNVDSLAKQVDELVSTIRAVPQLAAQAADAATQPLAALIDSAKGLISSFAAAVAPVGALANKLPIGTVNVDIHIVQPLFTDLVTVTQQIGSAVSAILTSLGGVHAS